MSGQRHQSPRHARVDGREVKRTLAGGVSGEGHSVHLPRLPATFGIPALRAPERKWRPRTTQRRQLERDAPQRRVLELVRRGLDDEPGRQNNHTRRSRPCSTQQLGRNHWRAKTQGPRQADTPRGGCQPSPGTPAARESEANTHNGCTFPGLSPRVRMSPTRRDLVRINV